MGALGQATANNVIDATLGTAAFVATTAPTRCRYMTANGSATANGTELATSGGYTAGTGAPSFTTAAASAGSAATNSAITTTNMPVATTVGVEVWDSAGTPVRKWWGALTASKTTAAGDTFTIAAGSLTFTMP